jgi:hypothetical protein
MKQIQTKIKPSISDIELMYQLVLTKYPELVNSYEEISKKINLEFNIEITDRDLQAALDTDLQTDIEDLQMIYTHVR